MKILIFSGTTEGRILSKRLAELGAEVTVSVATEYGREEQGTWPGITVLEGRMDMEAMAAAVLAADLCVDATHPYAAVVTANIRQACRESGKEYLRLLRKSSAAAENADLITVNSAAEAAEYLAGTEGNILFTTGSKELPLYKALDGGRIYARVLPLDSSLDSCQEAGVPRANIIAMQGPFSRELNEAMMHQFGIRWMVTKDGGDIGGFTDKIEAARNCGVRTVLIRRPEDSGLGPEEIFEICREKIVCS